jgi:hypothetical protein
MPRPTHPYPPPCSFTSQVNVPDSRKRGREDADTGLYDDRRPQANGSERGSYSRGNYEMDSYDRGGGYDRGGNYDRGGYERGGGHDRNHYIDGGAGGYDEHSSSQRGGYGGGGYVTGGGRFAPTGYMDDGNGILRPPGEAGNRPVPRKVGNCFDWQRGLCKRGEQCKFSHGDHFESGGGVVLPPQPPRSAYQPQQLPPQPPTSAYQPQQWDRRPPH